MGNLPTTNLEMSLGAKSQSTEIWSSVIEKCEKKLTRWKTHPSRGGTPTLINFVLDSLPTYMMSDFPIPAGVVNKLDKFLQQGNNERKGYNLFKWDAVTVEKRQGGLGIKNLKIQSKALRIKWLWKYSNENQSLWRNVISATYEEEQNWMTKEITTRYGVSLWRSIRALWNEFKTNTTIKVANGAKTDFWKDEWHEA